MIELVGSIDSSAIASRTKRNWQTSVRGTLDLRNKFKWVDRGSCPGNGDRVPSPNGFDAVEGKFFGGMGMNSMAWNGTMLWL